jgi:hypothetical protein
VSRSYNIVRPKFWAWAKEKGLSPAAREFALYCLTSEHTNGIGCFRLPVAYAAEDLGTVPATVRKTIAELAGVGFVHHDDASGWLWIVGFLDHNPIANSNVGKSLVPFVETVPRKLPFYADFLDALERADVAGGEDKRRFPEGFINGLRNGIGNGSGQVCQPTITITNTNTSTTQNTNTNPDAGAHREPSAEQQAFDAWNAAAARTDGRWPIAHKLTDKRRARIRARIKDAGDLSGFLAVLAKAEASRFVRKDWKSFGLDKLLLEDNWQKISDGNYDDGRQPIDLAPVGRVGELRNVVDELREHEQRNAWRGAEA